MKKLFAIILAVSLALSLCACGKLALGESSALDGVTAKIESIDAKTQKNGATVFQTRVKITNGSEKPVMKVGYELTLFDASGTELYTFKSSYLNIEKAIQPGETVYGEKGFQRVLDGKPARAEIKITSLEGEDEIAPVHLPQPGEYLYKCLNNENLANIDTALPVAVFIRIDQGGYERVADLRDEEDIRKAVEFFTKVTIGGETNETVTDNYNAVGFTFEDGTEMWISLNLQSLEVSYYNEYHLYVLDSFADFWSYAQSVVHDEQ